jgi:hypothetical protein
MAKGTDCLEKYQEYESKFEMCRRIDDNCTECDVVLSEKQEDDGLRYYRETMDEGY